MSRRTALPPNLHLPRVPATGARAGVLAHISACGPFDVVGDVHGCLEELLTLLGVLGYQVMQRESGLHVEPPSGRTLVFVGDLVDRGPDCPGVLRLAMRMMRAGHSICVAGNRDVELLKALKGRAVQASLGMSRSLDQIRGAPRGFPGEVRRFLDRLASHHMLDGGNLVIAHAGLKESLHGCASFEAREIALRGDSTGKKDEYGLPIYFNWAAEYQGKALVAYGHSPVPKPVWMNNTVNLDTGCVYGGHLTALRYPERETVSVPAQAIYYPARKPFPPNQHIQRNSKQG